MFAKHLSRTFPGSAGEPGRGKEGAEYLVSKEVVAVGADQWGLEVVPFETGVGVRGPPDPAAAQRHLDSGEHEQGSPRC